MISLLGHAGLSVGLPAGAPPLPYPTHELACGDQGGSWFQGSQGGGEAGTQCPMKGLGMVTSHF